MSIKNIRNEIYGKQKKDVFQVPRTTNEILNNDIESEEEEEKNIWKPFSMDLINIKKVIKTLDEDPDQWEGENKTESTNNLSNYINEICDDLHKEQIQNDDKEVLS